MSKGGVAREVKELRVNREDAEMELRKSIPFYAEQVRQMQLLYGEDQKSRELKQPQRMLIALGMALISASPSAVEWTVTRCLNHGCTSAQIAEVIELALLNGGTFVVANARFAHGVMRLPAAGTKKVFLSKDFLR